MPHHPIQENMMFKPWMEWGIVGVPYFQSDPVGNRGTKPAECPAGVSRPSLKDNLHISTKKSVDKSDLSPGLPYSSPHLPYGFY